MDIYTLIHHDHETARKLIEKIDGLSEEKYSNRFFMFEQLKEAVIAHADAEEGTFYVALEQYPDIRSKVLDLRREHTEITNMLEKLSNIEMADAMWGKVFSQFRQLLFRHMEKEEDEIFAAAHDVFSHQQAHQLLRSMIDLKSEKQELIDKAG